MYIDLFHSVPIFSHLFPLRNRIERHGCTKEALPTLTWIMNQWQTRLFHQLFLRLPVPCESDSYKAYCLSKSFLIFLDQSIPFVNPACTNHQINTMLSHLPLRYVAAISAAMSCSESLGFCLDPASGWARHTAECGQWTGRPFRHLKIKFCAKQQLHTVAAFVMCCSLSIAHLPFRSLTL